jgi:hypothetical protein
VMEREGGRQSANAAASDEHFHHQERMSGPLVGKHSLEYFAKARGPLRFCWMPFVHVPLRPHQLADGSVWAIAPESVIHDGTSQPLVGARNAIHAVRINLAQEETP